MFINISSNLLMRNFLCPTSEIHQLSTQIPSNASGIGARTSLKKPAAAQKKPHEALGSSPPPAK